MSSATANDKLVFYNASICSFAQFAAIALKEAGAEYEQILIDLFNKPEWYKNVNSDFKIPALTVEGGDTIVESLVIIEYIADRFPEDKLLLKEPLARANVRFVIELFVSKVISEYLKYAFNSKAENALENYKKGLNAGLIRFGKLLTKQSATGHYFIVEQFSLVYIAIAPFFLRIQALSHEFLDGYTPEARKNERLLEFIKAISSRPSVQES